MTGHSNLCSIYTSYSEKSNTKVAGSFGLDSLLVPDRGQGGCKGKLAMEALRLAKNPSRIPTSDDLQKGLKLHRSCKLNPLFFKQNFYRS